MLGAQHTDIGRLAPAGFANEGQFLAISSSSLGDVNRRLLQKTSADATSSTLPFQVSWTIISCVWKRCSSVLLTAEGFV